MKKTNRMVWIAEITLAVLFLLGGTFTASAQDFGLGSLELGAGAKAKKSQAVKDPFLVDVSENQEEKSFLLDVQIATDHYLYKDHFIVTTAEGNVLQPQEAIPSARIKDPFTGEDKDVFERSFKAKYLFTKENLSASVKVEYMGCSHEMCYMPQELDHTFSWADSMPKKAVEQPAVQAPDKQEMKYEALAKSFKIRDSASGSMNKTQFNKFLDSASKDENAPKGGIEGFLEKWGLLITIPFIILLGIGLNLTPCVLPMIPINLAIIGAGVKAGSKGQGFFLGGIYGLGMALAYGSLGLAVVLAGTTFGSLNSSPWFNFGTAAVFVVLSLAMFDVFTIDFSRFKGSSNVNAKTGFARYLLIFGLGAFSALLAGACVAPALISVLLISANIYNSGSYVGLLLPFLLGLGMALPWPVAGAGIAALPKPGMWMVRVKQAFGILILLFAAYYGYEGYKLWKAGSEVTRIENVQVCSADTAEDAVALDEQLAQGMQKSLETGKPIFLDFWATWCKSCMYMEKTTFSDPEVRKRLESEFVVIKLQAEQPAKSPAKEILNHYGVIGLPSYFILVPQAAETK
ncbi:MAG: thioredoxin family protein [Verrucomicrobia bacterium]|nr:thioredoxin family protein [Verrucomicrobiota bacterium]